MDVREEIHAYINSQPAARQKDLLTLHEHIRSLMPGCRLWFLDGRNSENMIVTNPNIGYGTHTLRYADGSSKEFYRIGMSANTSGLSIYLMSLPDKKILAEKYSQHIGKATLTGYCIRFRKLADLNWEVLTAALREGIGSGTD